VILLDLVQQGPVTDSQKSSRRFPVPAGLVERGRNRVALRFSLDALDQRFQTGDPGLRFDRIKRNAL